MEPHINNTGKPVLKNSKTNVWKISFHGAFKCQVTVPGRQQIRTINPSPIHPDRAHRLIGVFKIILRTARERRSKHFWEQRNLILFWGIRNIYQPFLGN